MKKPSDDQFLDLPESCASCGLAEKFELRAESIVASCKKNDCKRFNKPVPYNYIAELKPSPKVSVEILEFVWERVARRIARERQRLTRRTGRDEGEEMWAVAKITQKAGSPSDIIPTKTNQIPVTTNQNVPTGTNQVPATATENILTNTVQIPSSPSESAPTKASQVPPAIDENIPVNITEIPSSPSHNIPTKTDQVPASANENVRSLPDELRTQPDKLDENIKQIHDSFEARFEGIRKRLVKAKELRAKEQAEPRLGEQASTRAWDLLIEKYKKVLKAAESELNDLQQKASAIDQILEAGIKQVEDELPVKECELKVEQDLKDNTRGIEELQKQVGNLRKQQEECVPRKEKLKNLLDRIQSCTGENRSQKDDPSPGAP